MHIGERIRELRRERDVTAEDLASKLGKGSQTVFRWEWGNTSPRVDDLLGIAERLGVTLEELVRGVNEPSPGSHAETAGLVAAGAA
jgi:transcriptional regulator with XRE-family HTH domain